MSKITSVYKDKLDMAWYDSSNIKYSECQDIDNSLKVLTITFNNGKRYVYKDVDVNDYLMFREDKSQGKAFNKFIRKYPFEKIEDADINIIDENLNKVIEDKSIIIDNESIKIYGDEINFEGDTKDIIIKILNKLDIKYILHGL